MSNPDAESLKENHIMTKEEQSKYNLNIEEMTKAGLQFGHKKSKVHPTMKPYLFGVRNTIYIIDLEKAKEKLEVALQYIENLVAEGKVMILVGTKAQFKKLVKEVAEELNMPYVNERWLGGTFTNFKVIKKRIDYFNETEKKSVSGEFEKYTKKEQAEIKKKLKDLEKKLGGIRNLAKLPDAIFVLDMKKDKLAVKEARNNGIKVIGIADVNIDPNLADYPIIANDDAFSSVKYILDALKNVAQKKKEETVQ